MLKYTIIAAIAGLAAAECPDACSGHGTCCSRDMCTCYEGWTGNNCGERMCPFGITHVRSPIGDVDSDGTYDTAEYVTDQYPAGLTERYGTYDDADEHPDYMECSNQGLCDRDAGQCECFPGFSGAACQRASCPDTGDGMCSGHGTCRSMRQMAQRAGERSFTYALWDQDAGYGCDCDPGYSGPSCAERECPYGVDPLYTADGTPVYSRFAIRIEGTTESVSGDFRLKVYDVHGESYITDPIWVDDNLGKETQQTDNCADVIAAIEGLPNGAVASGVTCTAIDDPSTFGIEYRLQFVNTPGYIKSPEVYESALIGAGATISVFPWGALGEFADRFTNVNVDDNGDIDQWDITGTAGTVIADDNALANLGGGSNPCATQPCLLKIGDDHLVITGLPNDQSFTSAWAPITNHQGLPIFGSDDTVAAGGDAYVQVGSANMTTDEDVTEGDILFIMGQRFTALTSGKRVTLDRPFGGDGLSASWGDVVFTDTEPYYVITESSDASSSYTYVSQCSNRGNCDVDSGICECFAGYKGPACATQVSC